MKINNNNVSTTTPGILDVNNPGQASSNGTMKCTLSYVGSSNILWRYIYIYT